MKRKYIALSVILIAIAVVMAFVSGYVSIRQSSNVVINLDEGWTFNYNDEWLEASVPGSVHMDLMNVNAIPDPFYATNEDSVKWVANTVWSYKKHFDKSELTDYENVELVFEGLDTYSEVFLNGVSLGKTDNMFVKWSFPINVDKLKDVDNEIVVMFTPSRQIELEKSKKLGYDLPELFAFSRKAPYHDGWDWGPELTTVGIWQPVYFNAWNDFEVSDLQVYQSSLNDSLAKLDVQVRILSNKTLTAYVECLIDNKVVATNENVLLQDGINNFTFNCDVENPELWWPNGMGDQNLYNVEVKVKTKNYKDDISRRIGLRTIELSRKTDSIGAEFAFIVNGIPTFMKGANYIPPESFMPRMTDDRYRELIEDCKSANMNMIRMWGGGQYENKAFYDYCDEMGILVWQDFMFSCALYPGDNQMIESIREEAVYQIKRLRNHPSLALWCGNNEVHNGWQDWGWQDLYTPSQRDSISTYYDRIFKEVLPNAVSLYDRGRSYSHTSPIWGWGHDECITDGDSHYWGVWWGEEPFEVWNEKTGRFMSEYGFQSYPQLSTIESFTPENQRFIGSDAMNNHQKHGRGKQIVDDMVNRYYGTPNNFENYLYVSQLLQAYGIGRAIEVHRMKMPHCMGTLYWQFNDCWPVVSWSSVDYYGNWKALHYEAQDLFEPLIVATDVQNDSLFIYLVSDMQTDCKGSVSIDIKDFNSKTLKNIVVNNRVAKANTSSNVVVYPLVDEYVKDSANVYIKVKFTAEDNSVEAEKLVYLAYPKNLNLSNSNIDYSVRKEHYKYVIEFKANTFAKDVYIYTDDYVKGRFSDNFIDIEAGETVRIEFVPSDNSVDNVNFKVKMYI